jgi:hypothetical protein
MKPKTTDLSKNPDVLLSIESKTLYEGLSFSGINANEGLEIVDTEFSECTFNSCKLFRIHWCGSEKY